MAFRGRLLPRSVFAGFTALERGSGLCAFAWQSGWASQHGRPQGVGLLCESAPSRWPFTEP